MLRISDLTFGRGDETLFADLDMVLYPGQRMAVVGRNGVGKSTLFKLILGELEGARGTIDIPTNWRIGHMAQEVRPSAQPALEYVIDGDQPLRATQTALTTTEDPVALADLYSRLEDLGGYQAEAKAGEILHGLGFSAEQLQQPFNTFSGGWRIRLNLAQALMSPSDLLLLDEPTNHLDLEAILWLEQWLLRFPGALLIIAHDRGFLNSTATHVLHLAGGGGTSYSGDYSSFERQRSEALLRQQAESNKREAKARHIQSFVDRFRAKASKAKQVQSRIKALEKMQANATLVADSDYRVQFENPDKVSNPLLTFRNLRLGYLTETDPPKSDLRKSEGDETAKDESENQLKCIGQNKTEHVVLSNVSQTVLPGARIGVLGANGAGKSTLLKGLIGELPALAGTLERGRHASVSYFAQHQLESLDLAATAYASVLREHPDMDPQGCRDYLGGWGFSKAMIERPVASLSGGEKARLVLALLARQKPAMIILDEPTNHLDLDMRDALALALQEFSGAVIIVAHDRTLLDQVVDEFWLLREGQLHRYEGDVADYTETRRSVTAGDAIDSNQLDGVLQAGNKKALRQQRSAARAKLSAHRQKIKALEKQIDSTTNELKALESRLADKATYDTLAANELNDLLSKAARKRQQLEQAEEEWFAASSELEAAELDQC